MEWRSHGGQMAVLSRARSVDCGAETGTFPCCCVAIANAMRTAGRTRTVGSRARATALCSWMRAGG